MLWSLTCSVFVFSLLPCMQTVTSKAVLRTPGQCSCTGGGSLVYAAVPYEWWLFMDHSVLPQLSSCCLPHWIKLRSVGWKSFLVGPWILSSCPVWVGGRLGQQTIPVIKLFSLSVVVLCEGHLTRLMWQGSLAIHQPCPNKCNLSKYLRLLLLNRYR